MRTFLRFKLYLCSGRSIRISIRICGFVLCLVIFCCAVMTIVSEKITSHVFEQFRIKTAVRNPVQTIASATKWRFDIKKNETVRLRDHTKEAHGVVMTSMQRDDHFDVMCLVGKMHTTNICGTFQAITAQNHHTNQPATNNNKVVFEVAKPTHQDTDLLKGFARAEFLRRKCQSFKGSKPSVSIRVSLDKHYQLLFCPMCKMASTFWTRVFKMLQKNRQTGGKTLLTPYDVPISQAPAAHTRVKLKANDNYHNAEVDGFFKFLFIRDPYSMIFSAYVDKIVGPNPYFWKYYGINAISLFRKDRSKKCGSDVRFDEFVKYIIHMYKTQNSLECHVDKFEICRPCEMNYTYIGKMETFKEDAYAILSHLKQEATIEAFRINFTDFHADDAIEDSVHGPYSWKKQIVHCMTWQEALKRIWKKLQIRGIIGRTPFPLGISQAESISEKDFTKLLKDVRRQTTAAEKRAQTKEAFSEAFGSVPFETLYQIKGIYNKEFEIFDYEETPDKIFNRNDSSVNEGGHWFS